MDPTTFATAIQAGIAALGVLIFFGSGMFAK